METLDYNVEWNGLVRRDLSKRFSIGDWANA